MKTPPDHRSQVFGTPWEGVHGTAIESMARHYGRHWHATYGLGLLEHGAQRSASGRGKVDAYAGDLIATNPGEVHDGRRSAGRRAAGAWCISIPPVMAAMNGDVAADVALTRPVIQDARLGDTLRRLFTRLDDWRAPVTCDAPDMRAASKRSPARSRWPKSAACCATTTPPPRHRAKPPPM
jgi:hypothetical protein